MKRLETLKLTHPLQLSKADFPETVLALGYFDGVHLGHQEVICTARNIATEKGLLSAVMTFDPHPIEVLRKTCTMNYLTPLQSKIKAIEALGIDRLYIVHFSSDFAQLTPQQFVDDYLIGLNVSHVVAGFDYTYGHLGKGTMKTLPLHGRGELAQTVVDKVEKGTVKISSTLIRELLSHGQMQEITTLLNRPYSIEGVVVHGDKRGRTIGFPTANLELNERYLLPKTGVHAVTASICGGDRVLEGVCNIGFKPTFTEGLEKPTVEVHLFNFAGDLYGKKITVQFHDYIRQEQKFNGVAELVARIQLDKKAAEAYFAREKSIGF